MVMVDLKWNSSSPFIIINLLFKPSWICLLLFAKTYQFTLKTPLNCNHDEESSGVVGGMNDLASLHLLDCQEIECILDFKEDALIMRLVELRLSFMNNLTDLYRGPPLQVLRYFEKLELLDIQICMQLHVIFPRECKLQNLKILRLSDCKTNEVLFSASVAQSLQQLEELRICGCNELKHIIAASEEIIPTPLNSHFLMNNLRDVDISYCQSLESIFPICYVKGLTLLKQLFISYSPNLKFVFGECDYKSLSLHQYKNQVMLPHLEHLNLISLDNLIGMCLENCQAQWPSQSMSVISIQGCPKLAKPWFSLKVGHDQKRYRPIENPPSNLILLRLIGFPELHSISWVGPAQQIWNFQCLKHLIVGNCENLQCLLSMETHRSLPELISFEVYNCQKLEQVVEADEELVEIPNAELYFPKLEHIKVYNCNKLKSLFPFAMVTMLPQLSTLEIAKSTLLKEVFSHGTGDDIINEIQVPLPNLTKIAFDDLPNFVDICRGCNLYIFKLRQLNISNCPKTGPTLRKIQVTFLPFLLVLIMNSNRLFECTWCEDSSSSDEDFLILLLIRM
ncbi:hypothetical protein QL285_012559 [Trifolium repens]|nr:hypothetical protein QL285_012559 [Trifolium repens]